MLHVLAGFVRILVLVEVKRQSPAVLVDLKRRRLMSLLCLVKGIRFYLNPPFRSGAVRRQSVFRDRVVKMPDGRLGRRRHLTAEIVFQGILCIGHEAVTKGHRPSSETFGSQ